jgi:hypothetical protein
LEDSFEKTHDDGGGRSSEMGWWEREADGVYILRGG